MLRICNPVAVLKSGSFPLSWLSFAATLTRELGSWISSDTSLFRSTIKLLRTGEVNVAAPENAFSDRWIALRVGWAARDAGMEPVRLLELRERNFKDGSEVKRSGSEPVRALEEKLLSESQYVAYKRIGTVTHRLSR